MYETECVAIVRYVWRNKADPKLCMLLPHIKPDQEVSSSCLLFVIVVLFVVPVDGAVALYGGFETIHIHIID